MLTQLTCMKKKEHAPPGILSAQLHGTLQLRRISIPESKPPKPTNSLTQTTPATAEDATALGCHPLRR
jgi:hypothetical protein